MIPLIKDVYENGIYANDYKYTMPPNLELEHAVSVLSYFGLDVFPLDRLVATGAAAVRARAKVFMRDRTAMGTASELIIEHMAEFGTTSEPCCFVALNPRDNKLGVNMDRDSPFLELGSLTQISCEDELRYLVGDHTRAYMVSGKPQDQKLRREKHLQWVASEANRDYFCGILKGEGFDATWEMMDVQIGRYDEGDTAPRIVVTVVLPKIQPSAKRARVDSSSSSSSSKSTS